MIKACLLLPIAYRWGVHCRIWERFEQKEKLIERHQPEMVWQVQRIAPQMLKCVKVTLLFPPKQLKTRQLLFTPGTHRHGSSGQP